MYDGTPHSLEFIHDETGHSFVISGFDPNTMNCADYTTKRTETNVADYETGISLKDPESASWEDGSTLPVPLLFYIFKRTVLYDKPILDPKEYDFDGEYHTPEIIYYPDGSKENIKPEGIEIIEGSTVTALDADNYHITFHLKEDPNTTYKWGESEGNYSTENITHNWKIKGFRGSDFNEPYVKFPDVERLDVTYDKKNHYPNIGEYDTKLIEIVYPDSTLESVKAGDFKIIFRLKYPSSCVWEDGSTKDFVVDWRIKKHIIEKPIVTDIQWTYDKNNHHPTIKINENDKEYIIQSGTSEEWHANDYKVMFTLYDPDSCIWAGSGGYSGILEFPWHITKATERVLKPRLERDELPFDGTYQYPKILGFNDEKMINVLSSVNKPQLIPGDYNVTIGLKPTPDDILVRYVWDDDSMDDFVLPWKIVFNDSIKKPHIENVEFTYDGEEHHPDPVDFNENTMLYEGDKKAVKAGTHIVEFKLKYPEYSCWEDGGNEPFPCEWVINKITIKKPSLENTPFTYNGKEHSPLLKGFDTFFMLDNDARSVHSAIKANIYYIYIHLKDPDSISWEDGSNDPLPLEWVINKAVIKKPYLINNTPFIYNGGTQIPTLKGFNALVMLDNDVRSVHSAVDANTYYIYIHLKDPDSAKWEGGTNEPAALEWVIRVIPIKCPYIDPKIYKYTGKQIIPVVKGFRASSMSYRSDSQRSGAVVGDYKIYIQLSKNYEWADLPEDEDVILVDNGDILLRWWISKIKVKAPTVSSPPFVYDTLTHSPNVSGYDTDKVSVRGDLSAVDADNYEIIFSLKDKEHCEWDTGGSKDIVFKWSIAKRLLKRPVGIDTDFTFNGGYHVPVIDNINDIYMTTRGNEQKIHADNYTASFELIDKINLAWEDGGTDVVNIPWVIHRKKVPNVYLDPKTLTYNGNSQTTEIKNYNSNIMRVIEPSIMSGIEVETYDVYVELVQRLLTRYPVPYYPYYKYYYNDYHDYEWKNDGTINTRHLTWQIIPKKIKYPVGKETVLTYNLTSQSPKIDGYIKNAMGVTGTYSASDVDKYSCGFYLYDTKNYAWEDGITDNTPIEWEIIPAILKNPVDIPYQTGEVIYNGREQSPVWLNYDIRKLTITDGDKGTNAGGYTTTFVPTKNYTWEDDTRNPITLDWKIHKLGIDDPVQVNALYYNGETQEPVWNVAYNLTSITFTGNTFGINAGLYDVTCNCDDNCYFKSTDSDTCNTQWQIRKKPLSIPTAKQAYPFTGEEIIPEFFNYDAEVMDISGETSEFEIGDYIADFTIKDTDNYTWDDNYSGYENYNSRHSIWKITYSVVTVGIPYQSNYLIYNRNRQSPAWANYNQDAMILLGGQPSEINAGEYYVIFRLKDNYKWSDGTTEDKKVPWRIYKKQIPRPYIKSVENTETGLYYYGLEGKRYPVWENYDTQYMSMSGDTFDIDNSYHTTDFDLRDPDNYEWDNGLSSRHIVNWKLSEPFDPTYVGDTDDKKIHIPRQANHPYEDGATKYPEWDKFDNTAIIKLGGAWEGVSADEYLVVLSLRNGYVWEDGTYEIKKVPWKIYKQGIEIPKTDLVPIHIPEQINIPKFNGYVKKPEWDKWEDYGIDYVKGDLYGVPAGSYHLYLRPKSGYIWEDGTDEVKHIIWYIDIGEEEPQNPSDEPKEPEPEKEGDGDTGGEKANGDCCGCCCCCC